MSDCATCNNHEGSAHYARSDLGDAKRKFIRRQTAETHAALVAAKAHLKYVHAVWDKHVSADHAGLAS